MAAKKEIQSELITIEELKLKHKVKNEIYEGVKAFKGWSEGKKVTEKEFLESVRNFLGAPIDKVVK